MRRPGRRPVATRSSVLPTRRPKPVAGTSTRRATTRSCTSTRSSTRRRAAPRSWGSTRSRAISPRRRARPLLVHHAQPVQRRARRPVRRRAPRRIGRRRQVAAAMGAEDPAVARVPSGRDAGDHVRRGRGRRSRVLRLARSSQCRARRDHRSGRRASGRARVVAARDARIDEPGPVQPLLAVVQHRGHLRARASRLRRATGLACFGPDVLTAAQSGSQLAGNQLAGNQSAGNRRLPA